MNPHRGAAERVRLEALIAADARALTAESDQLGRVFAAAHQLRPSDFRALLHVLVAETAGSPLTSGELRHKMGLGMRLACGRSLFQEPGSPGFSVAA